MTKLTDGLLRDIDSHAKVLRTQYAGNRKHIVRLVLNLDVVVGDCMMVPQDLFCLLVLDGPIYNSILEGCPIRLENQVQLGFSGYLPFIDVVSSTSVVSMDPDFERNWREWGVDRPR